MGSLDTVTKPLGQLKELAGNVSDLFKGLDYFTGDKFAKLIAGGYMK